MATGVKAAITKVVSQEVADLPMEAQTKVGDMEDLIVEDQVVLMVGSLSSSSSRVGILLQTWGHKGEEEGTELPAVEALIHKGVHTEGLVVGEVLQLEDVDSSLGKA